MSAYAAVPQPLQDIPNWIVWKSETVNGKPNNKTPYDAKWLCEGE
jgi:primase-polymerase (primpol)-like protein